jgi:TolB-like protein/Tfp pilus assembly protein PilF
MDTERWTRIKQLVDQALAREPSARGTFLAEACEGDAELRAEVESLLRQENGSLFETRDVPAHPLVGRRLGSYEMLSPIGAGGMGEVYRARDLKLGREVAIKVLPEDLASDPDRLRRFGREARTASSLNHPNIVTIHDIDEQDGIHYIAMELVEGSTLREMLRDAPLPTPLLLALARQAADGLARAHAAGVVHRDLKPENLIVSDDGLLKILDFGLAKVAPATPPLESDDTLTAQLTEHGAVMGTIPYMSPEQAAGRPVDYRSDQFSLGTVLYEMASGRRAFKRGTPTQTLAAIIEGEPEPLGRLNRRLPSAFLTIVDQCLAKNPERRFASTRDLATALQTVPDATSRIPRAAVWIAASLAVLGIVATSVPGFRLGWESGGLGRLMSRPANGRFESLVVLPLSNLSGDPGQEFVADGLTEALIANLAKIGALRVISRTTAMTFKASEKTLSQIATELGVDAVIEGSVLRVGDRVRVAAQLIDVEKDEAMWAETYDRDFGDLLVLESEVARAVAEEIQVTLTPDEAMRLASGRPVDPRAHEAYLKGRSLLYNSTREATDEALRYFETALAEDPRYARAYVGIALAWAARQQYGWATPQEAGPRRVAAVQQALALDDDLAEAHYQLAAMNTWTFWDFPAAEKEFLRAIELDPNYPEARVFYARFLNIMNRPEEALPQIERALELDPRNTFFRGMYAVDLCWARRYDDAIAQVRQLLAENPRQPFGFGALRIAFLGKGMLREALEAQIRLEEMMHADDELLRLLRHGYDAGTYRDTWRAGAELLEARFGRGGFVPASQIAMFYVAARVPDKALDWLERSVEQRDPNVLEIRHPFQLDTIPGGGQNPRFRAIVERIGLP